MSRTLADVGETRIIASVSELFASDTLSVGIGDDAAVFSTEAPCNVLAADAMVENVHFDRNFCPAFTVGKKLVTVNLSDMAAMGARGRFATLTASLPTTLALDWASDMFRGVAAGAQESGLIVAGGDITKSPGPIILSLSVQGQLVGDKPLLRSGAQPGDSIYVTGELGAASYGLEQLRRDSTASGPCIDAFLDPAHQQAAAEILARSGRCNSLMDLSDGLVADAERMSLASDVNLRIDIERLPVASGLPADHWPYALFGGEDYQLLFTCPGEAPVKSTCIGRADSGVPGVTWQRSGAPWCLPIDRSFEHFR